MNSGRFYLLGSVLLSALGLAGCGGGGSASTTLKPAAVTITGSALAGAPLFGNAYIKDATGKEKGPVAIDKSGNFAFTNMTGMQAPFILEADGTAGNNNYQLCSVATGSGTANINPLTNLAVAALTGKDPSAVFADPAGNDIKTSINNVTVSAAIAQIQTMLKPILDAYNASAVNPLNGSVVSNNAGLDGVFDVVKINVTPDGTGAAQVSVDNNLTGTTILATQTVSSAIATPSQTATTVSTATTGLSTDASNLQAITLQVQALATQFAATTPNLDPFFATNYGINSGRDRAHSIQNLTPPAQITGISPLTVVSKIADGTGFDYEVSFVAYMADGSSGSPDDNFIFTNEGGVWKLKGNGYKSSARIWPKSEKWVDATGATTVKTGIDLEVQNPGNYGIASVTVTGPGFPGSGLVMVPDSFAVTQLDIMQSQQDTSLQTLTDQTNFFPLGDATISGAFAATAAPFTYTFTVKDATGATIETRTRSLAVGPVLSTALDATYFPKFTGSMSQSLSMMQGKSSTSFGFSMPTAYATQELDANLSFWTGSTSGYFNTKIELNSTQATVTGAVPATLQGAWLSMEARDANNRRFDTVLIYR